MIRPVRPDGTIETGGVFVPVVRDRVVGRLTQAARQRVVLIIAPAGYGKSVALRQFLDTLTERRLRYDVLPDHATLLGFLRGFAEAISEIAPDARTTLPGAYEKNVASASPGVDLALWMHSHLKSFRGIIAIDDLHVAQEDREVTRFLSSLIERTKGRVQWVIASRSTTGLPIGTWLAYGDSDLAIDEHDLKFSIEEARETARAFRLAVRDDELYELLNVTDGWATAISFALRSSTRSVDLRNISTMTREMIYHYLAEQVYSSLGDDERRFVEACALLPEIDLDVLTAAGFDNAAAMLEHLRSRVAFISEREPGKYRLHDLFREFAMHQLQLRGNNEAMEARTRFAAIMLESGRNIDALRLLTLAKAHDEVSELLIAHGSEMVVHGYVEDVDAALAVCGTRVQQEPLLLAVRGLVSFAKGKIGDGERALQRAIRSIAEPSKRARLTLRLVISALARGEKSDDLLDAIVSDDRIDDDLRVEAQALVLLVDPLYDEHRILLEVERLEALLSSVQNDESLCRILGRLALALIKCGRYDAAADKFKEAIEIATPRGLWIIAARAYHNLAQLALYAGNSPSLALWNAQQAVLAASRAGDQYELQGSLLTMLSIETRRGNAERAQQLERQLGELNFSDTARSRFMASSQAHRAAWSGKFAEAHRFFASVLDRQHHRADRVTVHAFHALTLALDGHGKRSAASVEALSALLEDESPHDYGAGIEECALLFAALAEIVNGRIVVATRMLKRKSRFDDEPATFVRRAIDELLRFAKSPSYECEEFESCLEAIRVSGWGIYARYLELARAHLEQGRVPEEEQTVLLTPSEGTVLRLLAAGLSPKEIAAEVDRSPLTVQTHIQNLMRKLEAHGRNDAIATARRLGLLQ